MGVVSLLEVIEQQLERGLVELMPIPLEFADHSVLINFDVHGAKLSIIMPMQIIFNWSYEEVMAAIK